MCVLWREGGMLCIEVTEVGGRGGDMRERGPHCYVWVGGEDVMMSVWHGVGGWRCLGGSWGAGEGEGKRGHGRVEVGRSSGGLGVERTHMCVYVGWMWNVMMGRGEDDDEDRRRRWRW